MDMAAARGLTEAISPSRRRPGNRVGVAGGAGPDWIYTDDATGSRLGRSEGLAPPASACSRAAFSAPTRTNRCAPTHGAVLLGGGNAGRIFQVTDDNPLVGLEQRAELLRKLGNAIGKHPRSTRATAVRPGNLTRASATTGAGGAVDSGRVLSSPMDIWPSPVRIDGRPLGDVGNHSALIRSDATSRIVPFHKLSQWLSYSLIEPWNNLASRCRISTASPDWRRRNVACVDAGLLTLRIKPRCPWPTAVQRTIVEWRALIALLDRLANTVRRH